MITGETMKASSERKFNIESLDEYQKLAMVTAMYPPERAMEYVLFGLIGEIGEFCSILSSSKTESLRSELGDVFWYLAACYKEFGIEFDEKNLYVDVLEYRKYIVKTVELYNTGQKGIDALQRTLIELCGNMANNYKKVIRGDEKSLKKLLEVSRCIRLTLTTFAIYCAAKEIDLFDVLNENLEKLYDRMDRNVIKGSGDNR